MFGVGERRQDDHFLEITDHRFPQFFQQALQDGLLALIGEERQSEEKHRGADVLVATREQRDIPLVEIVEKRFSDENGFSSFVLSRLIRCIALIAFDLLELFVDFFDGLSNRWFNTLDEHGTEFIENITQLFLQIIQACLRLFVTLSSSHQFIELFEIQTQLLNVIHQNGTDVIFTSHVFKRATNGIGVTKQNLRDRH